MIVLIAIQGSVRHVAINDQWPCFKQWGQHACIMWAIGLRAGAVCMLAWVRPQCWPQSQVKAGPGKESPSLAAHKCTARDKTLLISYTRAQCKGHAHCNV